MARIIRGTTPTITYTFKTVDVADLTAAYLTIKRNNYIAVEKDLSAATVDENTLSWTLTQADTLAVAGDAYIMLNWKTNDGTRGASAETAVKFAANHKEEVI